MKAINTKFGILYIEEWEADHLNSLEHDYDNAKILDSNKKYLFTAEAVEEYAKTKNMTPQEMLDKWAKDMESFDSIEDLLNWIGVDYEFVGTEAETIEYLNDRLYYVSPIGDYNYNPLNNDSVKRIGDFYIVTCEED